MTSDESKGSRESNRNTSERRAETYWRRNLKRLGVLLGAWFLGSYGASILLVDQLDRISFFGFPLGFWFSQQGSILVFLLLILIYIRTMNALDDEYEADRQREEEQS